jgi:hypothetical protein
MEPSPQPLIWLQDPDVFERYTFVQVFAQLRGHGMDQAEAIAQATADARVVRLQVFGITENATILKLVRSPDDPGVA